MQSLSVIRKGDSYLPGACSTGRTPASCLRPASPAAVCALLGAVVLLIGCSRVRDTPAHHAVHKGEIATLLPKHDGPVWIAIDKTASEDINDAVESGDRAVLAGLETAGKAFQVDRGARVEVIGERYNDREVRVISANQTGKTGWVPFEWLQPVPPAQQ